MKQYGVGPQESRLRSGRRIWGPIALAVLLFLARATPAEQWSHIGPEGGLVVSMLATSSGAIFLGTPDGHIFVSEDGAAHWELRGRVSSRTDGVVAQLVATPYGGTLFAAVWYREAGAGGGVFRSDEGARSWSPAGLAGQAVRALEMGSAQEGDLLAGTRTGVFRSPDNGNTWRRISLADNQELQNIDSLAVDPQDSATVYAGTYHLPWKTTDGGAHWQVAGVGMIDDSDVMSVRVDSINSSRLYLSACSGIYRSENRGGSWIKLQGIPYGSRRTQSIVQDRDNPHTLFAATTQGLWLTRDAGENWKRTTPADWVVNSVVILPAKAGSKQKVIIGTEGQGVLVSEDGGENFLLSNIGFRHVVGRQLVGDPQRSGHLLLLTGQDPTQLQESFDFGATWHLLAGIAGVRGNPEKPDFQPVAQVYGTFWGWLLRMKSDQVFLIDEHGGNGKELKLRWKVAPLLKPNPAKRKKPAVVAMMAPLKGNVLAVSRQYLFVASSSGVARCGVLGDCQRLSAFAQSPAVEAVHVSTDESHVLVLADGKLGISADGGRTAFWRDLPTTAGPGRWVHYANEGTRIVLGTNNGLYRSTDGGFTWALLEHGLPTTRMQSWLETGDRSFVTTDQGGIYISPDNGESWIRLNRESERSGIVGLVELSEGQIGFGSLSEGVLAER